MSRAAQCGDPGQAGGQARAREGDPVETIDSNDFNKVELRVGRVLEARPFPEARKPAYVLHVDFGPGLGVRKSSAQVTDRYRPEDLVGRLVVAVVNFPDKQIGPLRSQCLVTGFHDADGHVALCVPDGDVPLGTRLL
jgi:tRNA-binding protein